MRVMVRAIFLGMTTVLLACGDAGGGETGGSEASAASTSGTPTSGAPTSETGASGGSERSGGSESSGDPFDVEPMCSSGKMWKMGDEGSPHMHPGRACRTCHMQEEPEEAGRYPIAGTVYATGHEIDDCLGVDGEVVPVFVEITTADARLIKLAVNSSGNFCMTSRRTADR